MPDEAILDGPFADLACEMKTAQLPIRILWFCCYRYGYGHRQDGVRGGFGRRTGSTLLEARTGGAGGATDSQAVARLSGVEVLPELIV